jgi:hypothetical protein
MWSNSAVFQAGGLVVVIVEVGRKAYLASLVPVIVDSILNEHQIIVDIIAFVQKGDFPRSRLGEKQRGKILAGWVSRKMRTIAQFAIRDTFSLGGDGEAAPDANRASYSSFRSSSGAQIGLASVGSTLRNVEPAPQILEQRELEQQLERISALPPDARASNGQLPGGNGNGREEMTPTGPRAQAGHDFDLPDFNEFDDADKTPGLGPNPGLHQQPPEIRLPEFQGVDWRGHTHPLQVHGASGHGRHPSLGTDDDWTADAIASMNLAERDHSDGRGY